MTKFYLKKGREKSILRKHPWIFSGAIHRVDGKADEGDIVDVYGSDDEFLARGLYCGGSLVIKLLTFDDVEINAQWFNDRIGEAFNRRKGQSLPSDQTNAFRLMHGEGDGVPGLIIDIYSDVAVIQPHAEGIALRLKEISAAIREHGIENIVHKPVGNDAAQVLSGNVTERTLIKENGVQFNVDVLRGQKTGFFLDQRDNRALLADYSNRRRVLNVFSYTGGFSMYAAKNGAESVVSLDASKHALAIAEENAVLNECTKLHSIVKADAVPYLEKMEEMFDLIVLDPPAFAKHNSARHKAIQAYRRINEAAIKRLPKDGILFTFSCSQAVDRTMFDNMVLSAAVNSGRRLQILHKLRQPSDHPVQISHPEGEYLKGLVVRVID